MVIDENQDCQTVAIESNRLVSQIMGLFRRRKNKKFNYTPRHYQGEGSPYQMKGKFDDYRKTLNGPSGIKEKFTTAWEDYKSNNDESVNKRVIIIILVLVVLFLLFIDFDLSIFSKK